MAEKISLNRFLVFGDDHGIPMLLRQINANNIVGVVAADIRPQQHDFMRGLAEQYSLCFLIQPRSASAQYAQFVEEVRMLAPQVILVNSYSMLISEEILSIAPLGGINIHGALLPQYRGANPIQWALLNNEVETGVTMHRMTTQFDHGDIVAQRRVPICFDDTWRDVQERIVCATELMLAEEMPKILGGEIDGFPQDEQKARYYHRRHPSDGLIDWQKSVLDIYNLIRALVSPHPGAFYYVGCEKVVLDFRHTLSQVAGLKYSRAGGGQMLKSRQVYLAPFREEDAPVMFDWINNREQAIFNAPYKPVHEGQHNNWFQEIQKRNDVVIFGIRSLNSEKLIGSCQLHGISFVHRSAELQIRIGDVSKRNRGYGTEAVNLLLDFAFKDLNLQRVFLNVFADNQAAVHVYRKIGFVQEGLMRRAAHVNGQYVDVVHMAILRDEYENR